MEKLSYHLSRELSKRVPTTIIAWGGSQIWLPWFVTKAFFESLYLIHSKQITNIHIADGVLAPLGLALKQLTGRRVSITINGLDITYSPRFYQALWPRLISKLDRVICISQATLEQTTKRGIPSEKCTVIGWGVDPNEFKINATRSDLEKMAGMNLEGKKVLLTSGRLVKRKGVAWFVNEVLTELGDEYVYLIIGEGPERRAIESAILKHKLQPRAKLLGKVSDHSLKIAYNTADVFVMPNIPVPGDMEGLGIVALEAASVGIRVVASSIEGIRDVNIGSNGTFFDPANKKACVQAICRVTTESFEQSSMLHSRKDWLYLYLGAMKA